MERYNLIVLGAGSGGLTAAAGAAAGGARVALLEKHRMGGDCLDYGCVPSKAFLRAAKVAHTLRMAATYGIRAWRRTIRWSGSPLSASMFASQRDACAQPTK